MLRNYYYVINYLLFNYSTSFVNLEIHYYLLDILKFYLIFQVQIYNRNSTVEHILRKNIFKNYDKIVKPYAPQDKNSLEVSMKMLVKSAELVNIQSFFVFPIKWLILKSY